MSDDDLPPFFAHLGGTFAVILLQVGRQTGLLDAVLAGGGTATDIAGRAGSDLRNTDEWLRGMTVAGYLTHDDGVFAPTQMTATTFSPAFPVSANSVLDGLWAAPQVYDDVVAAVRSGGGIPSERLVAYAPFAGVNTPTYEQALVGDWIAAVPGLTERLAAGARVAEIAPGNGAAAAVLGRAFPASTVVGYDLATSRSGTATRGPCLTRVRSTSSTASTRSTTWAIRWLSWPAYDDCWRRMAWCCSARPT